jgi:DNA repair exonuclease SbcCD nuclease subunit
MSIKIIHIADVHVGMSFATASFGSALGKERRREIKETTIRVIERCETQEVDVLLIAGDLFEETYVTLSELMDLNHHFSKLTKTKVCIGAGNHDPIIDRNAYFNLVDWCEQVHIFSTKMSSFNLEAIKTKIYSFSWNQKYLPAFKTDVLEALDSEYTNILMLHGDVYQQNDYLTIDPALIKPYGFDYLALGHIHKYDFIEPWVAYPGSLEPLDFSETGSHGLIEGTIDESGCHLNFVPFSKREFHVLQVNVEGAVAFEAIKSIALDALKSIPKKDMIRLKLTGLLDANVNLDLEELKAYLQTTYHYIELRDETSPDLNLEQLEKDYESTLIGAYITYMTELGTKDPVVEKALYEGLKILLEEQVKL